MENVYLTGSAKHRSPLMKACRSAATTALSGGRCFVDAAFFGGQATERQDRMSASRSQGELSGGFVHARERVYRPMCSAVCARACLHAHVKRVHMTRRVCSVCVC